MNRIKDLAYIAAIIIALGFLCYHQAHGQSKRRFQFSVVAMFRCLA